MSKNTTKAREFLNKKALFDYEILEKYEAGIELQGSEVKAIRAGRINLKDSFIRIIRGEVFLLNAHISHLNTTHFTYKPDEKRARKLLLHKKQIMKLNGKVTQDGLTIVPIKGYFNKNNIFKLQIALAKGKKLHDKREAIKKKEANIEAQREIKRWK
jgi:SsrA-binding protein